MFNVKQNRRRLKFYSFYLCDRKFLFQTRMHSSRSCTARFLPYGRWGSLSGESPWQRPPQTETPSLNRPAPLDRMTDASKNITLPQTSFAGGNKLMQRCNHIYNVKMNSYANYLATVYVVFWNYINNYPLIVIVRNWRIYRLNSIDICFRVLALYKGLVPKLLRLGPGNS